MAVAVAGLKKISHATLILPSLRTENESLGLGSECLRLHGKAQYTE